MRRDAAGAAAAGTFVELAADVLTLGHAIRFCARGRSMAPSIRDGDVLRVDPLAAGRVRLGEVVLYRDGDGRPVAHRVVGPVVRRGPGSVLVIRGDAFRGPGERVRSEWILGRVAAVERGGPGSPSWAPLARRRGLARAWGLRLTAYARAALGRARAIAGAVSSPAPAAPDDGYGRGVG